MSTDNSNNSLDNAKKSLGGGLSSAMALKESNPKVFFGGIGFLLVFVVILMLSGGDERPALVGGGAPANLATGQKYVLHSPNSLDAEATIQLVPVPGTIAAYDEAEDEGKNPCNKIVQGTPVSVINLQDAYGKQNVFAQVKVEDGKCKDKEGWVLSVDLK